MSGTPRVILDETVAALGEWIAEHGWPRYHARQIERWIFQHRAEGFAAMTDLPQRLRVALEEAWTIFATRPIHRDETADGTWKLLLQAADTRAIECVLMAEEARRTVCISTQVGCGMGCVFCASGLKGLVRNLSTGEMLEQVIRLRNLLPVGESLSNIVVMGMGESLANLDNLIAALDRICSPAGLGMSPRRVTISTVGLPDKIVKLAELNRPYHLAVSLHAATEAKRNELVPINQKVGLKAVLDASDQYFERTGRQVTYEYTLLAEINDLPEDAAALGGLMAKRKAHVNLIPYNPIADLPYRRPTADRIHGFVAQLKRRGVSVTVRKTKGRPIDAACGQLRRRLESAEVLTPPQ